MAANMVLNPLSEEDEEEEDLLSSDFVDPSSQRILAVSVTKKVSSVPDVYLSPGAQKGYEIPDTALIVMNGSVERKHVKFLFDTGSTHNFMSSKLVKNLKLQTQSLKYKYTMELANGKGTKIWDQRVVDLSLKIQSYEEKLDFEITRLARFDIVLSKQ
ncbi:hypothetical protein L7F22_047349 [Adiantum nelumboides]|nr:hypothetical protein [Adiantum nelumboides]MCO5593338.1 hypothetical protein [Adiantum nelumboides]